MKRGQKIHTLINSLDITTHKLEVKSALKCGDAEETDLHTICSNCIVVKYRIKRLDIIHSFYTTVQ